MCNYENLAKAIHAHSPNLNVGSLMDAAKHGADGGFNGFIYYTELAEFYKVNSELLWDHLCDVAEGLGVKPLELMTNSKVSVETQDGMHSWFGWFALEEVGRWFEEMTPRDRKKTAKELGIELED